MTALADTRMKASHADLLAAVEEAQQWLVEVATDHVGDDLPLSNHVMRQHTWNRHVIEQAQEVQTRQQS